MYIPLLELVYPVLGLKKKGKGRGRKKRRKGGESPQHKKHSWYFLCLLHAEHVGGGQAATQHPVQVR
jgi:hypothetical protein